MKRNLLFAISVLAVLAGTGCSPEKPEAVAKKFIGAVYHFHFEAARTVSTEETRKVIGILEEFSKDIPDSTRKQAQKITVEVDGVEEQGNTAIVKYHLSSNPAAKTVKLVRDGSKWLVNYTKMDGNLSDTGPDFPVSAPPADTVAPPAPAMDSSTSDTLAR